MGYDLKHVLESVALFGIKYAKADKPFIQNVKKKMNLK